MTSEDVIHDFFVPAFRVKADVLPGRYTSLWFEPTTPGRYHLFCAEYCGTRHSGMIGQVVVMEPTEYQVWLSGGPAEGSLASAGEKLFQDLACNTCHRPDAQGRGPVLQGLFGKTQSASERRDVDWSTRRTARIDPESSRKDHRGISTDHARLSGPGQRRAAARARSNTEVAAERSTQRRSTHGK